MSDLSQPPAALAVDPKQLVRDLLAAGWHVGGQRTGAHVRLLWPGETQPRGRSTVIPIDTAAPEYPHLMTAVLRELARAVDIGRRAAAILAALAGDPEEDQITRG